MTTISKAWIPSEDYWSLHPMMKEFNPCKSLYSKDKSSGKKESSKIMWAVAMLIDPNEENSIRNQSNSDKKKLIAIDYLDNPKFNWESKDVKELIDFYTKNCLTLAEKELIRYLEKLEQRGDFISSQTYTMDSYSDKGGLVKGTATQLDKMMIDSGKIFSEIEAIQEKLNKESISGHLKGGAAESASEAGEI